MPGIWKKESVHGVEIRPVRTVKPVRKMESMQRDRYKAAEEHLKNAIEKAKPKTVEFRKMYEEEIKKLVSSDQTNTSRQV